MQSDDNQYKEQRSYSSQEWYYKNQEGQDEKQRKKDKN